jgi:hypothetical protein
MRRSILVGLEIRSQILIREVMSSPVVTINRKQQF